MNVTVKKISTTSYELTFLVSDDIIKLAKKHAVAKLSKSVKVAGFRAGKAPEQLIEKALDQSALQDEFINEALNHSLPTALQEKSLRPVTQPSVELVKFVPYSTVEFKATVLVLGPITLPDIKKLGVKKPEVQITADDVNQVIKNLRTHLAKKNDVDRAAKTGDQVWIDFEGKDKDGKTVNGASGKDYPLLIGSNTFIPGFEANLIGLKKEDEKTFDLKFPADYGVAALQGRKVTFTCKVNKVQEVVEPDLNDDLARQANPSLSTVAELKEDIKKQLTIERNRQAEQDLENAIVLALANKTKVDIPDELIEEQIFYVKRDLTQNLAYRGQTLNEYLKEKGLSEEEYTESELKPEAKRRLVAGISLSEIASQEKITVTPEELEVRIKVLEGQYASDTSMRDLLKTEEGRSNVASKLLSEKVVAKLKTYC